VALRSFHLEESLRFNTGYWSIWLETISKNRRAKERARRYRAGGKACLGFHRFGL